MDIAHIQECANGVRDLVAEGNLDPALKLATYLQREGQLAILEMDQGKPKTQIATQWCQLKQSLGSNLDQR